MCVLFIYFFLFSVFLNFPAWKFYIFIYCINYLIVLIIYLCSLLKIWDKRSPLQKKMLWWEWKRMFSGNYTRMPLFWFLLLKSAPYDFKYNTEIEIWIFHTVSLQLRLMFLTSWKTVIITVLFSGSEGKHVWNFLARINHIHSRTLILDTS